jgi:predicted glycoside hydrolase/deacetylase ChbG (UPF0249 family)
MATSKRLIVNADEFGLSDGVNQGIIEAHRRGILTSATLIVSAQASAEAARLARANDSLGVGLHLAFAGGPVGSSLGELAPTAPVHLIRSLLDNRGRLPSDAAGLGRARPEEILAEARGQVRRFRELMGRDPTHLDVPYGTHRIPAVLEALVTVAWETGFPVRSRSQEMRRRLQRERIRTPEHLADSFRGERVGVEDLVRILGDLPLATSEMLCHPARGRELASLTDREVRQVLQAAGVKLINYKGL